MPHVLACLVKETIDEPTGRVGHVSGGRRRGDRSVFWPDRDGAGAAPLGARRARPGPGGGGGEGRGGGVWGGAPLGSLRARRPPGGVGADERADGSGGRGSTRQAVRGRGTLRFRRAAAAAWRPARSDPRGS